MNPEHKDATWLVGILKEAIASFDRSEDQGLLQEGELDDGKSHGSVGECAITHRLAVHLERVLGEYGYPNDEAKLSVDCEYNRHLGKLKEQNVKGDVKNRVQKIKNHRIKEHPDKEGWYFFSVFPDIIVHRRGDDELNLLVIEVKRASNSFDDELDNIKLHLFTAPNDGSGYGYILGATVIAFDDDKFGERRLEVGRLFIDGQCRYRANFLEKEQAFHDFLKAPECGYGSDEQRQ
jgi:hypothetical protein